MAKFCLANKLMLNLEPYLWMRFRVVRLGISREVNGMVLIFDGNLVGSAPK